MRRRVSSSKLFLGVDIVEYKKARVFYSHHQNRLKTYFNKEEVLLIQKGQKPYETLALLLAAKEAVFKSSGLAWMGTDGFRKIRILSQKNSQLSFRLRGNFKKSFMRRPVSALSFVKSRDYVIAECRSAPCAGI